MGNVRLQIPPEFKTAPAEARIAFVQDLWDQIAKDPESVPVPEHHKQILEQRLAAHRANPWAGRPWTEVRDELLARFRNS